MPTSTLETQLAMNRTAYEANRERIRSAGAGHFAAIAGGRLLAITTNFDDAVREIDKQVPSAEHFAVFPTDEEPAFEVVESFVEAYCE